jgi:hypothetical protein
LLPIEACNDIPGRSPEESVSARQSSTI